MSAEAFAHGAADRLHDVRGERSNVPRWGAGLYGAEVIKLGIIGIYVE